MTEDRPTDRDLCLVALHGGGHLERALATVQLAKRRGREDELHQIIEAEDDSDSEIDHSG